MVANILFNLGLAYILLSDDDQLYFQRGKAGWEEPYTKVRSAAACHFVASVNF